eukprot:gene17558-biopygen8953
MATQDGIVPTQDGIVPAQDGIVPVRTESGQDGIGPGRNRPHPGRNYPGRNYSVLGRNGNSLRNPIWIRSVLGRNNSVLGRSGNSLRNPIWIRPDEFRPPLRPEDGIRQDGAELRTEDGILPPSLRSAQTRDADRAAGVQLLRRCQRSRRLHQSASAKGAAASTKAPVPKEPPPPPKRRCSRARHPRRHIAYDDARHRAVGDAGAEAEQ